MPKEKFSCSVHQDERVIVEETDVFVHGHPGITDWNGSIGPMEEELEMGPTYRLRLSDGRDGLITITGKMKNWGGATGNRYSFEGTDGGLF